MRLVRIVHLILACALLAGLPACVLGSPLKRVAVIPFDSPQEYAGTPLSRGLTAMITSALVKAGGVEVIERAQLDSLLKEHNLSAQGILDPATAQQVGKVLGVDYIIGGKISEFGVKEHRSLLGAVSQALGGAQVTNSTARVVLDLRMIDARTAKVLLTETATGEDKSSGVAFAAGDLRNLVLIGRFDTQEWSESRIGKATRKAVQTAVTGLLKFFPPVGQVLSVFQDGQHRYAILDRGAFSGVKKGQEFSVYRERPVKDAKGKNVWEEKQDVGRVRVEEIENERCKAVIIEEQPAITEGDLYTWQRSAKSLSS